MNYFDYLCGVYDICFRTPAKLNASERQQRSKSSDEPKFYDYSEKPITEDFLKIGGGGGDKVGATVNILGNAPFFPTPAAQKFNHITKSTQNFHNSDWDVVPKSCAGDWLLRYSQNETNFNPWHIDAKFSHFELVPWRRQQNKRIDLTNAIGWEPFKLTPATQNQLRTLQKFELARSKRLQKQRMKSQQQQRAKFRRQIKIRFIFALEVRQKKMKLFRANRGGGGGGDALVAASPMSSVAAATAAAATYQRKLILQRDQQLYVFNARGYDLMTEQHWGYFSQRNKGVEEMLVKNNASQLDLLCMKKCLMYYPANGSSSSSKMSSPRQQSPVVSNNNSNSNSKSELNQESQVSTIHQQLDTAIISCEKCKSRCVIMEFIFLIKILSLSRCNVRAHLFRFVRLSTDKKASRQRNKYQHHIYGSNKFELFTLTHFVKLIDLKWKVNQLRRSG